MKTVCVTGHRPKGFPCKYGQPSALQLLYEQKMRAQIASFVLAGYTNFVSGGALGVDLDFAEIVLEYRQYFPITLEIALACPKQDKMWKQKDKKRLKKIIKSANFTTIVSQKYDDECMKKRNRYMVDKSDAVFAVWNGQTSGGTFLTLNYANKCKKPTKVCQLKDIEEAVKTLFGD